MKQIDYQSYDQPEGFRPVQRVDATQALDRRNAQLRQAEQQKLAGLRRNTATHVANAERSGEGLRALAQFSTKLTDYLVEKEKADMEERIKQEDAAGEAAAWTDFSNGTLTTSPEYDAATEEFDSNAQRANTVAADILDEDGVNYPASQEIRAASGQYQMGYQRGKARIAAMQFAGYMQEQLTTLNLQGLSASERQLAVEGLRQQFMQEYGLSNINPQFLAREVYPEMAEVTSKLNLQQSREAAIEGSFTEQQTAVSEFQATKDVGKLITTLAGTVDGNGKALGYRGAWSRFQQMLEENPAFTQDDIVDIFRQEDPVIKGKTIAEARPGLFKTVIDKVQSRERTDYANEQKDEEMRYEQMERDLIAALPDNPSNADIEAAEARLDEEFPGRDSSKLGSIKKNNTSDAKQLEAMKETLTRLAESGLLTEEILQRYPLELQRSFRGEVEKAQERLNSPGYKDLEEAIDRLVESPPQVQVSPGKRTDYTVLLKASQLKEQLRAKTTRLMRGNPDLTLEQASTQAFQEIAAQFQAAVAIPDSIFNNDLTNGQGVYKEFNPDPSKGAKTAEEARRNLQQTEELIKQNGNKVLDIPGTVIQYPEAKGYEKNFGKPGWSSTISPMVTYVAQRLGVSPLTVINKQREAMDLPPLEIPPAIQATQELSPEYKKFLDTYKSPPRTIRAMSQFTEFKPELIPGGYGEIIERSAKASGIHPAIIAGILETESSWLPEVISGARKSSAGAVGIAQLMPQYHPGVDATNPEASIMYAGQYLKKLMTDFGFSLEDAIRAYNGGNDPGNWNNNETKAYLPKVLKAAAKYGYGKEALSSPATMRPSSPVLAYITGDTGPTSTGPHLDTKRVDRQYFEVSQLDDYIEVDYNGQRVPLSQTPQSDGFYASRGSRTHAGYDHALPVGTKIYAKNGAKITYKGDSGDGNGDVVAVDIPGMGEIQFLHGKMPQ